MMLLTQELRAKMPPLYSQEKVPDASVVVAFFCPWNNWHWYATEGSPMLDDDGKEEDYQFFGLVDGDEEELGYFSLAELESVTGRYGLKIERDMYWQPKPLSEVRKR